MREPNAPPPKVDADPPAPPNLTSPLGRVVLRGTLDRRIATSNHVDTYHDEVARTPRCWLCNEPATVLYVIDENDRAVRVDWHPKLRTKPEVLCARCTDELAE